MATLAIFIDALEPQTGRQPNFMKKYIITEDEKNGLIDWLLEKPMTHVEGAVNYIRNLKEFIKPDQDKKKKDKSLKTSK